MVAKNGMVATILPAATAEASVFIRQRLKLPVEGVAQEILHQAEAVISEGFGVRISSP